MSTPKRHHYIPQMLLKRFSNERGLFFVYDKRHPDKGVHKRKLENLFVERHLYTQVDASGAKDVSVETEYLASLESKASRLFKRLVIAARRGDAPFLTPLEKDICIEFFYCQHMRVPERGGRSKEEAYQRSKRRIAFMSQIRSPYGEDPSNAFEDGTFRRMWKNARSEILRIENPVVYEVLAQKQIGVAVIRKPSARRSFVIGSNPILKLAHPFWAQLDDPVVDFWLPLARDVAVSFCSAERNKTIALRDRHIESLNRNAFDQSAMIAGCSRELIDSLTCSAGD